MSPDSFALIRQRIMEYNALWGHSIQYGPSYFLLCRILLLQWRGDNISDQGLKRQLEKLQAQSRKYFIANGCMEDEMLRTTPGTHFFGNPSRVSNILLSALPSDLAEIASLWQNLPDYVKTGLIAMAKAAVKSL